MITLQRDTDVLVLLKLSDNDLVKICKMNRQYRNICNDDNFWRLKVVDYVGKNQEERNTQLNSEDIDEIIKVDYTRIEEAKHFLEFPTWKEFYIFLKENFIEIYSFTEIDFHSNILKYNEKNLPKWIDPSKFYLEYKRTSFISGERNTLSIILYRLSEALFPLK